MESVETEMTDIIKFNDFFLMIIPDIDYINGEIIPDEIDDIHRFSTSIKLLAFAGLGPSVYQSGNYTARRFSEHLP